MSSYEKMRDILKQVNLSDQRSELLKSFKKYLLPLETEPQFAEPVIPDEAA
jgi:hypothetical protein